jgi:hypothetical protein
MKMGVEMEPYCGYCEMALVGDDLYYANDGGVNICRYCARHRCGQCGEVQVDCQCAHCECGAITVDDCKCPIEDDERPDGTTVGYPALADPDWSSVPSESARILTVLQRCPCTGCKCKARVCGPVLCGVCLGHKQR